jgi:hypothetical protein
MNTLVLILIISVAIILIMQLVYAIHYFSIYPFTRDSKIPKQVFTRLNPGNFHERKRSHEHQSLSGWNDVLDKSWLKALAGTKDPAKVLEKAIGEYQLNPDEKNAKLLIQLSNHISNRIRYDENIDRLIESISELIKKGKKQDHGQHTII